MVEATKAQSGEAKGDKSKSAARKGGPANMALEVERPLYDQGKRWDFDEFKNNLLDTENIDQVTALADPAFLDGLEAGAEQDAVVLTSYPRSGNTMLRAYLEKITGIVSGSDADITKSLNADLIKLGL